MNKNSQMITVFTAKKIITMNDSQPTATAVAVRDGKILSVGSLEDLKPWLDAHPHEIDRTFDGKIVMPGFIDPHLHPSLGAATLNTDIINAFEWKLPEKTYAAVRGKDAYLARLAQGVAEMEGEPDDVYITWGHHFMFHGEIVRADLDKISSTRPIIVWTKSAHEMILNTAALNHFNLTAEEAGSNPAINYAEGRYWEAGYVGVAIPKISPFLFDTKRYLAGIGIVGKLIHAGGITSVVELSYGAANPALEIMGPKTLLDTDDTPFRTYFIPDVQTASLQNGFDKALEWIKSLPETGTHRLRFLNSVKLFADGAFFSQYMQLKVGYIDGHHGEWMTPPETFEKLALVYWKAGYKIHVHTNGDLGLDLVLDTLQKLQNERPRFDHRFTIEHMGYCSPDQVRKIGRLGAIISANPYYLYECGKNFGQVGLGVDRASSIARLGSVERERIPMAFHSDCPMAAAEPLLLVWVAVNRISSDGDVLCPEECVSLHQALRSITIDAAFILGVESESGSIVSGKTADFTVLEQDPYEVAPEKIKDIPIWGTVFEGKPFPIKSI
ncbi:amidohydrolase [Methyloglobulus sp.]|uniref:amidohydrolase n=1 Tax=Methyloglobulus sp. TaxID=2518622 RepID=UPI00180AA26B|nr:amidohydrolase [Methyloglobulus sp.]